MRILLRDTQNGLFYTGSGWVEAPGEAKGFSDANAAIDQAWGDGLQNAEVVMRFEDPELEIALHIVTPQDATSAALS